MLMPLLGITWAFGLLSVNSETVAFQYLFAIVNSLQVSSSQPTSQFPLFRYFIFLCYLPPATITINSQSSSSILKGQRYMYIQHFKNTFEE